MKRVNGAGITAVIDASLKDQYNPDRGKYTSNRSRLSDIWNRSDDDDDRYDSRKDNGKHKGWTIGKHKGWYKNGKLDSKWADRRAKLGSDDKSAFDKWFSSHQNDNSSDLERAWEEFRRKL
jgi:hypothetical protein